SRCRDRNELTLPGCRANSGKLASALQRPPGLRRGCRHRPHGTRYQHRDGRGAGDALGYPGHPEEERKREMGRYRRYIIALAVVLLLIGAYAAAGFWAVPHFARSNAQDFVRTH